MSKSDDYLPREIFRDIATQPRGIADAIADIAGIRGPASLLLERMAQGLSPASQPPQAPQERRGRLARQIRRLLARDGGNCWGCGDPLGDDITREHVISKYEEGGDEDENCRLCHSECNKALGNATVAAKEVIRAELHARRGNPFP